VAGALLACAPQAAQACAVCNAGGSPANRFAFFLSTTVLSLLPLGMFLAAALWLRARIRQKFADEFTERDAFSPAAEAASVSLPPSTAPRSR
jgi:hypothetical protein